MLKCIPVEVYKVVVVIGINHEVVVHGKDVTGTHIGPGQVNRLWSCNLENLFFIKIKVFTLFISEVY